MVEIRKVYKQSNSLGCIIPKSVAKALGLKVGDHIIWEIEGKKASIRKVGGEE